MILHTFWKALFTALNAVNKSGNQNIAGFTGAMDAKANLEVQMTWRTQPLGLLLIANNSKEVSIIHHPHNFDGTLLCPTRKVGCLAGMGLNATPVILDHRLALDPVTTVVSPIADIKACPASRQTSLLLSSSPASMELSTLNVSTASSLPPSFAMRSSRRTRLPRLRSYFLA